MSLPPHVQWRYDHKPKPGSKEQQMLDHLKEVNWLNLQNN
jgi:coproporphyrinogen III oxidase